MTDDHKEEVFTLYDHKEARGLEAAAGCNAGMHLFLSVGYTLAAVIGPYDIMSIISIGYTLEAVAGPDDLMSLDKEHDYMKTFHSYGSGWKLEMLSTSKLDSAQLIAQVKILSH